MARNWKSRQFPPPTSITEIARRYHAAAVALAQTLGLPLAEVLAQHRESVTAIFIESGRCDVRLPVGIKLPPLAAPPANATNGHPVVEQEDRPPADPSANGAVTEHVTAVTIPTTIPPDAGLPCGGQAISALKPPALSMLISKTARLLQDEGERWVALLHALEREREGRLTRGRNVTRAPEANGDAP